MKAKVLVVDDHWMVREGIRNMISNLPEVELVEEATSGQAAIFLAEKLKPDLVIMDFHMSHTNGILASRKILESRPSTRILFCTVFQDREHIFEAIQIGARGYISKEAPDTEFIEALRTVLNGGSWFRGEIAERLASRIADARVGVSDLKTTHNLSDREMEIIRYVGQGFSSKSIGGWLGISPRTVDVHKGRIYRKLSLNNASELVRWAMTHGLIDPIND